MDLSGEDGECQVEDVITPQSKKGKQGRLPFQTLSPDSPEGNKKRKSVTSPDCKSAKHPKVNTKENSSKKSEKGKTEDIVVITEEIEDKNESTTVKDTSKLEEKSKADSPTNKKTSGRGPGKHEKFESKVPVNPLTKFFKKIDIKDSKNEAQSPNSKNNEGKTEKSVNTESKKASASENAEDGRENEDVTETKKYEERHSDSEEDVIELHETSSPNKENEIVDTSHLNETDNMDVDSDPNSDSDDSHDNDDDSHKSDTDCKKTEHEDADSKDDASRGGSARHITPGKNKLLDSKGKETKLTSKQLEKKQNNPDDASNYSKKTGTIKKCGQQFLQKGSGKKSMMPSPTASTSNLLLNEVKSDGCKEIVDDVIIIKFDVDGDWELLRRALEFGSNTFTPLIILFNTNLSGRTNLYYNYVTKDNRDYRVFYSNQVHENSSEVLLLANRHVNLKVKHYSNNLDLTSRNYLIAVKVKLDENIKFNLIAVDICTLRNLANMKLDNCIPLMNNLPTVIFINCYEEQTPESILQTPGQFELKRKITYQNSTNSTKNSCFYMSKTHPVGVEKINIVAPALESPTCMIIKKDND